MRSPKIKSQITALLMIILIIVGCTGDENDNFLPYVNVDFYVSLATNNHLTIPGNSDVFQAGYGGVIVICVNQSQYYAFDASCPYEANRSCRIVPKESTLGKCTCCESEFSLFGGGYPTKGPAAINLKRYKVNVVNGRLWVHN
jgi:nitrite reductase/ring-hydroxylating ferredoxin subunit